MPSLLVLATAVLGILAAERLLVLRVTASPNGCAWLRRHRLFHPNTISLLRLPMGLVTVALWRAGAVPAAILWFAFWMSTDLTDGTIARRCGLQTDSGKWLDPLSDKCMYIPPLIMLAAQGILGHTWVAALVLIDLVGQASRLFVQRTAANWFGKAKTALLTVILALTAFDRVEPLPFATGFVLQTLLTVATLLAALSVAGKLRTGEWRTGRR